MVVQKGMLIPSQPSVNPFVQMWLLFLCYHLRPPSKRNNPIRIAANRVSWVGVFQCRHWPEQTHRKVWRRIGLAGHYVALPATAWFTRYQQVPDQTCDSEFAGNVDETMLSIRAMRIGRPGFPCVDHFNILGMIGISGHWIAITRITRFDRVMGNRSFRVSGVSGYWYPITRWTLFNRVMANRGFRVFRVIGIQ